MKVHELKCWPSPFQALCKGKKTFELRENDRDYQEGDFLILDEWDPQAAAYTGDRLTVTVTYILIGPAFGLPEGYCVMSVKRASP